MQVTLSGPRGATLNRTPPLDSGVFTPGVKITLIRAVIRIESGAEEAQRVSLAEEVPEEGT